MKFAQNRVVILSGPSGVGKDTVLDRWMAENPLVERVVAATTRSPREGEIDGDAYHFLSLDEFESRAANGDFLEFKNVHGNWYATPISSVNAILEKGGVAVLKIDVQGAEEVVRTHPEIVTIFLLPPSIEELERRIRSRATDSEEAIEQRLLNAKEEIERSEFYLHHIVNQSIEGVVDQLEQIVGSVEV